MRLRDLLQRAGLKSTAKYTAHYGEDAPLGSAEPFSRGIPIEKAMEEHTLVAYAMNGKPLSALNGMILAPDEAFAWRAIVVVAPVDGSTR